MNIRNVHNSIPLHLALARGAKACVGLLLAAGANYNLQVFILVLIFLFDHVYKLGIIILVLYVSFFCKMRRMKAHHFNIALVQKKSLR